MNLPTRGRLFAERRDDDQGFTLVELVISLGLFAIALVSLSLLFDRALSATGRARFDQVAKTLTQEKIEEIRSLPFHVPQREEARDVDLLDRYFVDADGAPDVTPSGATGTYNPTSGVWSYTSTETVNLGPGPTFTRTVAVQFVRVTETGGVLVRAPVAGYDSDDLALDAPTGDTVKVVVTVIRSSPTGPRSVSFDTIVTGFRQGAPSVEASGSALAAQISGVTFQDGDVDGVAAEVQATVAETSAAFREISESSAQATGDPVDVVERDPQTNENIQPELPTAGESSATAPNSVTGTSQSTSASLPAGEMVSVADPLIPIAGWGEVSPASVTVARVSALHSQNPESRAATAASGVGLHARDLGEQGSHAVIQVASASSSVTQQSIATRAWVISTVDLVATATGPAVTVWTAPEFENDPDFQGLVTIESMHAEVESTAGSTTSTTRAEWEVRALRVWDPALVQEDGTVGGYLGPFTFGFDSECGGWLDDPAQCGPLRTDGKEDFENPNPVVIPQAYVGTDAQGNPATSLQIVAGVTVQTSSADPAAGVSTATAAQKNILAISTRDDITGAVRLEPMLVGLGDASSSVSYIAHEH